MTDDEDLIRRVAAASARRRGLRPPVSAAELAEVEQDLGFPVHPLLAALYRTVGNGGFGPAGGLMPLFGGPEQGLPVSEGRKRVPEPSVVGQYLNSIPRDPADTWWRWPEGVVPVLDWGCAMSACVDCRSGGGTVLLFEPNAITGEDVSAAWFLDAGSLAEWLETWFAGRGWYDDKAEGGPGLAFERWPDAPRRL
ncbi:SMI1/KNR4 family protein [Yinghuangia soli]|uniref:SMI1/KNR4 family protein n=1 Tax=Yinghuangia soli TaxID=2908204 RepID=A0AA41Q3A4_9ACTN|nr:SMI1/KNR4 family protein [Yinghuangia soli]MCF2530755.1 SMI1/KNR4 family protein [Yinghuangia soli]